MRWKTFEYVEDKTFIFKIKKQLQKSVKQRGKV